MEFLSQRGIPFVAKDVSTDMEARVELIAPGSRSTPTIKRIVGDEGFGFIAPDEGSEDVFFHLSQLGPSAQFEHLREGDQVVFQTRRGEKGPQAFDVKLR